MILSVNLCVKAQVIKRGRQGLTMIMIDHDGQVMNYNELDKQTRDKKKTINQINLRSTKDR